MGEPIAEFSGTVTNFSTTKMGDLYIGLIVPMGEKYAALPVSDYPALSLDFAVSVPDWSGAEVPFDPWQLEDSEEAFDRFGYGEGKAGVNSA